MTSRGESHYTLFDQALTTSRDDPGPHCVENPLDTFLECGVLADELLPGHCSDRSR